MINKMIEEYCICGAVIPYGLGYYNYGRCVKCICGLTNRRYILNEKKV